MVGVIAYKFNLKACYRFGIGNTWRRYNDEGGVRDFDKEFNFFSEAMEYSG